MAPSTSCTAVRKAAALMTGGVFLLAGCGSDGTASGQPAPEPATPSTAPTVSTDPDTASSPGASTSPAPAVASPEVTVDSAGPAAPATEEPAEQIVITIDDFAYQVPDRVPPGSTVTVVNEDSEAHTATSRGAFDVALTVGETGTFTAPEEPGEYPISCLFHGNMVATLVVG